MRHLLPIATLGFCLVLTACGGSGSGESDGGINIGSGQNQDPVIVDHPIAYVQRPLQRDEDGALVVESVRDPLQFRPGAQLVLRDRASPSAPERVISDVAFASADVTAPQYDVRDVESSFDGEKLVFSMRAPEIPDADEDEQPTWNIWTYDRVSGELKRVIESDTTAEAGQDIDPHFLPDGRIVFSSTRQRRVRAVLLDEGKPQYDPPREFNNDETILSLHVMEADGTGIKQLSFNLSHDLDPAVMDDGRIIFSRWDNARGLNRISLYTIKPDGSELKLLYGYHSHDTGTNASLIEFVGPRMLEDGRVMVQLAPRAPSAEIGSNFFAIDTQNYIEHDRTIASAAAMTEEAQEPLFVGDVRTDDTISPAGRYRSATPLYDGTNRYLVTWSQCRLIQTNADGSTSTIPCGEDPNGSGLPAADPIYGVWVYDADERTQQVVVTPREGRLIDEAVVMSDRAEPPVLLDAIPGVDIRQELFDQNAGVLHIRSIYDLDGTDIAPGGIAAISDPQVTAPAQRAARFVRIEKPVLLPPDEVRDISGTAFGVSAAEGMREIIGYAPVEPDGSVKVRVPADVAFTFTVLDVNGRRISPRHYHWLQLRAGEEKECVGCHTATSELPHGRDDAQAASINPGAPALGPFLNAQPNLVAEAGETMAETLARINGVPEPNFDIEFEDVWTDPARRAPAASFQWRFSDLETTVPLSEACQQAWNARCRTVIHFPLHIQPLFDLPRQILDVDGMTVLEDRTCTTCHGTVDAMAAAQVPAAQLDLSGTASPDEGDHFVSYRELFFGDNEQELVNGVLVDRLVQQLDGNGNPVFQLDQDGNPLLDDDGLPIPVLVTVPVAQVMSAGGANASAGFFAPFAAGGTHADYLSPVELKLISEWLDLGAQYFNDPFVAPEDD